MKQHADQKIRDSSYEHEAGQSRSTISRSALAPLALAIGPAAIGMTELVPMGLLPNIASSLQISLPAAGMLVTDYALGVVIGAPLLATLTARLPKKALLLWAVAIYLLGNVLCAVVPTYSLLLVVRCLTGIVHGVIFGESAAVVTKLVAPEKQARAMATVFSGFTVAAVIGVPLGTWLGQTFGWHIPFLLITIVGICAFLAIALLIPPIKRESETMRLKHQFRHLLRLREILALLITVCGCGGIFTLMTYITPLMERISGFAPIFIAPLLLIFGIGSIIGNLIGGRLAGWRLLPSLMGLQIFVPLMLLVFMSAGHNQVMTVILLFLWASASYAMMIPMQIRVLQQAADATSLASVINVSASNLGNVAGSALGGYVFASQAGLPFVPALSALFTLIALGLVLWSYLLDRSSTLKERRTSGGDDIMMS
ncbi:MAG TPA: MFS transporter [Ktedonobacteraceae bacterium]|jgi:DHA1 family inner membrane transport protein|nr:MFS transporter [Ktedonobacteraceae bacterium]